MWPLPPQGCSHNTVFTGTRVHCWSARWAVAGWCSYQCCPSAIHTGSQREANTGCPQATVSYCTALMTLKDLAKKDIEIQPGFEPGSSEFWRHTHRVAAAITQFTGDSTKYFGTYHAEFPKPRRDPAWDSSCLWINTIYPLLQCQSSSSSLVRVSDWNSEDPGSNPGWISMSFFCHHSALQIKNTTQRFVTKPTQEATHTLPLPSPFYFSLPLFLFLCLSVSLSLLPVCPLSLPSIQLQDDINHNGLEVLSIYVQKYIDILSKSECKFYTPIFVYMSSVFDHRGGQPGIWLCVDRC